MLPPCPCAASFSPLKLAQNDWISKILCMTLQRKVRERAQLSRAPAASSGLPKALHNSFELANGPAVPPILPDRPAVKSRQLHSKEGDEVMREAGYDSALAKFNSMRRSAGTAPEENGLVAVHDSAPHSVVKKQQGNGSAARKRAGQARVEPVQVPLASIHASLVVPQCMLTYPEHCLQASDMTSSSAICHCT